MANQRISQINKTKFVLVEWELDDNLFAKNIPFLLLVLLFYHSTKTSQLLKTIYFAFYSIFATLNGLKLPSSWTDLELKLIPWQILVFNMVDRQAQQYDNFLANYTGRRPAPSSPFEKFLNCIRSGDLETVSCFKKL